MTKINLNATKLGQVRFSKDSFSVPNFGTVVSARASVRRDENGKPIPNSIAKIQLELVNSKTLNMILQDGGDIADLATFSAEVVAEEEVLSRFNLENLAGKSISLKNAQVALKWVSRGSEGSWGGFKLVLDNIIFDKEKTIEERAK